jgi:hypothetical protein
MSDEWKVVFVKTLRLCLFFKNWFPGNYFPNFSIFDGKHFPVKEIFFFISRKVFSFYFGWKTLSGSCEKFRNVILFTDYIKFDPQTFDCYIYFVFEYLFFNFIP